jgi:hypothetical protein
MQRRKVSEPSPPATVEIPMSRRTAHVPLVALALPALLAGCTAPPVDAPPEEEPRLEGAYLGQAEPGESPVPFAPGVVSTGYHERDVAMTPDGREIYWGVVGGRYAWSTILVSRQVDGVWSEPEVAPCCRDLAHMDLEPHVTPDGRHFLWLSSRPGGAMDTPGGQDIWAMDREGDGWGEPYPLPEPVNTTDSEYFPSVTRNGTLYFTRGPAGGGENLIYRSRQVDGVYEEPELLPSQVNAGTARYNAFVDPDERYLILGVVEGPDGRGGTDYYVVFRSEDDRWSNPVNLGDVVNTEETFEYSPYVSPDGRFLFFMTPRTDREGLAPGGVTDASAIRSMVGDPGNGSWDIYWMDAAFLEDLRPEGFTP